MSWNGVGELAEVEGRMDAEQYVDILDNHLLPSIEESGIADGDCIFQQDNDPKHTSRKAKTWMEENNITLLDWPHSLQTLISLNTSGITLNCSVQV